jgi:histidinol dehydrogenase
MPADPRLLNLGYMSDAERSQLLRRTESDITEYLKAVAPIVSDVAQRGDQALCEYAAKFDGAQLRPDTLMATKGNFDAAAARLDPDLKTSMQFAADAIRRFHDTQMPDPMWLKEMAPGVLAGERWTAIRSVACYVPRGKGAFPSVALMTTIPAKVAGVETIAVLTPPTQDGRIDDATLYACQLAGVDRVYKAGGALAVAAAAYGTATIPKCDKIVGPGSPWFMAAKRLLVEHIDPGSPAGPSESIILADAQANPRKVALDVLNEAEHGDDSSVYLVTESQSLATAVIAEIRYLWMLMSPERVAYSSAVLSGRHGGILIAPDRATACAFVNDYAAEHLMVHATDPWSYLADIQHAGEILLGEHSAISIANFVLGPNHVLPTSGAARTASPLSVFDYLKRQTIGHLSEDGYRRLAHHAHRFATYEGFDAHANAVSVLRDGESPEVPAAAMAEHVALDGDTPEVTSEALLASVGIDAALADMAADMHMRGGDPDDASETPTDYGPGETELQTAPLVQSPAAMSEPTLAEPAPEVRVDPDPASDLNPTPQTDPVDAGGRIEPSLLPDQIPNTALPEPAEPESVAQTVTDPAGAVSDDFADPEADPFSIGSAAGDSGALDDTASDSADTPTEPLAGSVAGPLTDDGPDDAAADGAGSSPTADPVASSETQKS